VEASLAGEAANYTVSLLAGQTVRVSLESDAFDAYLVIQDSSGASVAEDDDSGGNLNSAILFVAPADDTYTIVVDSLGGGAEGAFVLSIAESEVVAVTLDSTTPVEMAGDVHNFTLEAAAGDVVNIYTDNPDVDVRLSLLDPTGSEIFFNDDGGAGYAPYMRRVLLPDAGTYMLVLEPVFDEAVGSLNLIVETTEQLSLDDGPQEVAPGEDLVERLVFTATAGESYRLTVSASGVASAYVRLDQGDFNFYSFSFNDALEGSAVFLPQQTGPLAIEIDDNTYDATITYTITMEPAG
jgi:hypothetical protein